MRSMFFMLMVFVLVTVVVGCSQSLPTTVDTTIPERIGSAGHVLWGYCQLYIDPSVPSVKVVPAREALKHFNVKLFLNPPHCSDCITITPIGPYVDNILPVNITLKNSESIGGYDVRGILLSDDVGATLDNPDNYTSLFDNGGTVNINPFKAFAKGEVNRKFNAGASHTEEFDIFLAKFGKVTAIGYAVDASWPTRAKEPFQIDEPLVDGDIDSLGKNEVDITVDVFAAGDDVDEVWFDLSSMGVTGEQALEYVSGNTWKLVFQNTALTVPGDYICAGRASTSSSDKYLYSYFTLTIVEGVYSLADDVQPLFDTYCISCHQTVSPPLGLDLSDGNTYSNTVNVASVQSVVDRVMPALPQGSYIYGKITGNYLNFPFAGSGDRMPFDGPPYLSDPEALIVYNWIHQGALDN